MSKIKPYLSGLMAFTLIFCPKSYGQAVFAPVKNAKWTYIGGFSDYSGFEFTLINYHQVVKAFYFKDTLIDFRNYKLISISNEIIGIRDAGIIDTKTGKIIGRDTTAYSWYPTSKLMIRQSGDTLWALVNNDSVERLFFIYFPVPDSVVLRFGPTPKYSKKVFIDSLTVFQIANKNFNAWKGRSYAIYSGDAIEYGTSPLTFLDRIGPLDDFMIYSAFDGAINHFSTSYPYGLICYEDPEIGLIKFKNLDCNLSLKVATQDLSISNSIKSYFDRSARRLMIESEEINLDGWEMTLLNISGQPVLRKPLSGRVNDIAVDCFLSDGIYCIYIYNKATGFWTAKKVFITN